MAYDAADGYVLMFGGDANGVALNDTWTFAHGEWTQLLLPTHPGARTQATMAYDAADGYVLLWGGYNTTSFADQSDTWKFVGGQWSPITPSNGTKPGARHSASMAYDAGDRAILLFGGFRESLLVDLNDTWTYQGGTWTRVHPAGTGPSAREQAAMTFDPELNATLLSGGDSGLSVLGDLWSYVGGNWTPLVLRPQPSARTDASMVADLADGSLLLFGGNESVPNGPVLPNGDSWSLGSNFTSSLEAYRPAIDVGQSVTYYARAVANGTSAFTYAFGALPPGCVTADLPKLTCDPNRVGNYTTTLQVTASWGTVTNQSSASTNLSVHALPTVSSLTATPWVLDYNQRFTLWLNTTGGTGVDRYGYSGTPTNCPSFNVTELNCTVNGAPPPGGFPHTYQINATVTDALGGQGTSSVFVTVNPDPAITAGTFYPSPTATDVGYPTDLVSNATGGTGPLTYAYSGLPPGCSSANLSVLPCRPAHLGVYSVNLTVTDSTGYVSSRATTTLTVDPLPRITTLLIDTDRVDIGETFTVNALVVNGTLPFTFAYRGLPSGCPSPSGPSLTCTPTSAGTFTIRVIATDSVGGNASLSTIVTVAADPTIASFTSSSPHVDRTQSFTVTANASGGTGSLTYSYLGLPTGCAGGDRTSVTCATGNGTALGLYPIRVTVKDDLGWAVTAQLGLLISSIPTLAEFAVNPSTISLGDSTTISVVLAGGSGSPTFVFTGLPAGCAADSTASFGCTPTVPGSFQISVTARDLANYPVSGSAPLNVLAGGGGSGSASPGIPVTAWWGLGAGAAVAIAGGGMVVWIRARRRASSTPAEGIAGSTDAEERSSEMPPGLDTDAPVESDQPRL